MIRTAYNNRHRDHKGANSPSRGQRSAGRRDVASRRDGGQRRENSTVVHPWMSLPERLAAAQAAMRELAGNAAFDCPMGNHYVAPAPAPAAATAAGEPKPTGHGGVHVIIRKRRLPAGAIPSLNGVG